MTHTELVNYENIVSQYPHRDHVVYPTSGPILRGYTQPIGGFEMGVSKHDLVVIVTA